jgi:integrase
MPLHASNIKGFKLSKMMHLKAEIVPVFNYKNKKLSPGESAPVHISVYRGRASNIPIRKFVPTGIEIKADEWDEKALKVNARNLNYVHINKVLRDIVAAIEDFEYNLINKGQYLTSENLEQFLNNKISSRESFTEFFRNEIDPALKRGTTKEHQYTFNLLCQFRKNIPFDEINLTLIQEFDRFMRSKGLKQNTIFKHHQHIHRFIRLAIIKEKFPENKNPYRYFKTKKEAGNRINLTMAELKRIEEIEVPDVYKDLQLAKDLFLFSCYTGLRFSDVATLKAEHIVESGDDGLCIIKKMEKVPKPVTLPLDLLFAGKPREILNRYYPNGQKDGTVFPPISNQHLNRQLKIIAQVARINMRLTFHVARHTFGTMLAELTQNPYLIMDLMGHADIQTSMIYIHRSQERINRQLRNVVWW